MACAAVSGPARSLTPFFFSSCCLHAFRQLRTGLKLASAIVLLMQAVLLLPVALMGWRRSDLLGAVSAFYFIAFGALLALQSAITHGPANEALRLPPPVIDPHVNAETNENLTRQCAEIIGLTGEIGLFGRIDGERVEVVRSLWEQFQPPVQQAILYCAAQELNDGEALQAAPK